MTYLKPCQYRRGGRLFRFNDEISQVEWITKASDHDRQANKRFVEATGKTLWNIDQAGFITIDSAGLHRENWLVKAVRDEYLDAWNEELDAELEEITEDEFAAFDMLDDVI